MNPFRWLKPLFSLPRIEMAKQFSSDYTAFKTLLNECKKIGVLTGAGISAESGIPIFRGPIGLWRSHKYQDLATPGAFRGNPSLVWEFYHWRRELAFEAQPNPAHLALASLEKICKQQGRNLTIITQNVDGLHLKAGSENVIELHGALRKVSCTKCDHVEVNTNQPLVESLRGRGDPNERDAYEPDIPLDQLPRCSKCGSLARPYIVWFGENVHPDIMEKSSEVVETCDLFLVIGTSSLVYPAASFAQLVLERDKPVVEFNIDLNPAFTRFSFYFPGPCGTTLPKALGTGN